MNRTRLPALPPALPPARTALARTGPCERDADSTSELIVVGQFALRQKIVHASHAAHVQPHARLPPVDPTPEVAPHFTPLHNVPSPLPTEAWLALRTATASHRKAAYASFS